MERATLAILLLLLTLHAAAGEPQEAKWTCPVASGGSIWQGNGGALSHSDRSSRYAFDYNVPEGTPIVAARDGVVAYAEWHSVIGGPDSSFETDSNYVRIRHDDGTLSLYMHLTRTEPVVRVGEHVLRGELVGYSGNTGWSVSPHFHFNVVRGMESVPTAFRDFSRREGVPGKGDYHGPAPKPAVPQEVIDRTKKVWRAAGRAKALGWPEIGLLLLGEAPKPDRYPDYFYTKRIESLASELRGTLGPSESPLLLIRREVAGVSKGAKPPPEILKAMRKLRTPMKKVVPAMAAECRGEVGAAIRGYGSQFRRSKGEIRALLEARLAAIRAETVAWYQTEAKRRRDEAKRAPFDRRAAVTEEAGRVRARAREIFAALQSADPDSKETISRILADVERDYREICAALR